jgi:Flp pilus assembly protein TadD
MIRASEQRSDDDVRRAQAEIEAKPKPEHTNRKEARKLNQLGLEAYRAKQIDEAVTRFSEAHRTDRRDQEVSGNLGLALLDAGKLAEAEVALMEALLIEPARVGAWTVLGMVMAQRGDQAAALGALLNACRYSKDQAKTLGYFTQLAESDLREPVRMAASEALRLAGQ